MFSDIAATPRTPPPNERPPPSRGVPRMPGMPPMPAGPPSGAAGPSDAPPTDDGPYAGVLDAVHQTWAAALDEPQGPAEQAAPLGGAASGTPFGDDLRHGATVPAWSDLVSRVGAPVGVPTDVGLAFIERTSGGDPNAELAGGAAVGLAGVPLQAMRARAPQADPRDPEANLQVALGQLAKLHQETGDWDKAALRLYGAADRQGNPRQIGPVDGHEWMAAFKAARRKYGPRTPQEG